MSIPNSASPTKILSTLLLGVLLGSLGAVLVLPVDITWSDSLRNLDIPGDLRKAINLSEVFAHSLGVLGILGCVLLICVERRRALVGAVLLTTVAGATSNLAKASLVRVRPHSRDAIRVVGDEEYQRFLKERKTATIHNDGIELVLPSLSDARLRSFPSGHAATAWGLAVSLTLVFPRGCAMFLLFATLASMQRILSGAHYPSDVLAGTSIAFITSATLLSIPQVRRLFER
ncbi:MAG: phosphatase PAP2 family protein [Pirellulaceae bacterium]